MRTLPLLMTGILLLTSCSEDAPQETTGEAPQETGREGSQEGVVTPDKLFNKDGVEYVIGSDVPYTGTVEYNNRNGKIDQRISFVDGHRTALERYYAHGDLEEKHSWKHRERHGVSESYHYNGQLKERTNYRFGELYGVSETYDEKGQLVSKVENKAGTPRVSEETGEVLPEKNPCAPGWSRVWLEDRGSMCRHPDRDELRCMRGRPKEACEPRP